MKPYLREAPEISISHSGVTHEFEIVYMHYCFFVIFKNCMKGPPSKSCRCTGVLADAPEYCHLIFVYQCAKPGVLLLPVPGSAYSPQYVKADDVMTFACHAFQRSLNMQTLPVYILQGRLGGSAELIQ